MHNNDTAPIAMNPEREAWILDSLRRENAMFESMIAVLNQIIDEIDAGLNGLLTTSSANTCATEAVAA